ncbi:unnamed protein product [Miscanthus lutarioriparius]|uniref:Inositol polyphosphate-related phosphatase domain-containing protein n=1 Tax=Miscanthus lutarioriparius TaxID=422564 RepID=A0A811QLN3_9POAL|nr:unnamed protein product [Miscanthus lutarioriparius]
MTCPRSAASRVLGHQFVSEFSGVELQKSSMLGGQSETVKYRVFAGTWNVGGVAPPDDLDLEDWLDTKTDSYDIYVLGYSSTLPTDLSTLNLSAWSLRFQEVVPLNARTVLGPKQRRAAMKWNLLIGDALNNRRHGDGVAAMHDQGQGGVFRCLVSKQMVGIFVSVWTRSSLRRHVRHPAVSSVGTGVLGRLGNKGAVSVRFLLHGTSFCFVCCHLASGGKDGDALRRNADAVDILSRTSFLIYGGAPAAPDELPKKILGHDRVVLFRDLNYRIAMDDDEEARQLVGARKWSMLLENDELLLELCSGRQFDRWHEGHVAFAPTYKCDRILWRGKGMKQVRYERCGGYRLSDHRPVRGPCSTPCANWWKAWMLKLQASSVL